jgi:uncharacterized protein YbaR (Trm112 family)
VDASLLELLACPDCGGVVRGSDPPACESCAREFALDDGVPVLLPLGEVPYEPPGHGAEPSLAGRLRARVRPKLSRKSRRTRHLNRDFATEFAPSGRVLNVASGETDYGPHVVNLDMAVFPGVDVVGRAERLPFRDGVFDAAIMCAALNLIGDADRALEELRRVVRPGGDVLLDVPFVAEYQAQPRDYRHYTADGLSFDLSRHGFEALAAGVSVGPGSAAAHVLADYLALLFSGRSRRVYRLARVATSWLAVPLKYTDAWLDAHPMAPNASAAVWVRARRGP